MKTALIIGGTGQIGLAAARNLIAAGWSVRLAQRQGARLPEDLAQAVQIVPLDREEPGAVARAVAGGVDALIDTVAYDEGHARRLLEVESDVGATVVISTGSVYCDEAGRTLDEAAQNGFPQFPVPITEDQPTTAAGPATYSTKKVALEQALLQGARRPMTILRPFAIHGPGSTHPREWFFVKRVLDGRRRVPLAYRGESRFQTSATVNIAELIRIVLEAPATQVLNAADPEALSVAEIGRAIASVYGAALDLVPLDGPPSKRIGATPWSVAGPVVADMSRAAALGYRPVATYQQSVEAACKSAEAMAAAGVPFAPYLQTMFDYAAEDELFGKLS